MTLSSPQQELLDNLSDLVKSGNPATEYSDMSFPECPSDLSKIDKRSCTELRYNYDASRDLHANWRERISQAWLPNPSKTRNSPPV